MKGCGVLGIYGLAIRRITRIIVAFRALAEASCFGWAVTRFYCRILLENGVVFRLGIPSSTQGLPFSRQELLEPAAAILILTPLEQFKG